METSNDDVRIAEAIISLRGTARVDLDRLEAHVCEVQLRARNLLAKWRSGENILAVKHMVVTATEISRLEVIYSNIRQAAHSIADLGEDIWND